MPIQLFNPPSIDLGKVPVQLDNVVVHKLADDSSSVQFDLDVIWDGECDIRMRSDYGLQFGVRSVKLSGRMSFLLCPLTPVLPVVSAIQYAFINPPDLELDFTGLAQVADFTIIDKTIRKMIQDIMAGMVVLPNRMLYKMDMANDYLKTYQPPIGIVNVTIVKGRGFVVEKGVISSLDDVPGECGNKRFRQTWENKTLSTHISCFLHIPRTLPDVYVLTQFGSAPTPWRTKTVWDDLNPVFNERAHFVLSDYDQAIKIHAWDEDKSPLDPDDDLGEAEITVGDMLVAGGKAEVELAIDEKESGAFLTLACEVLPLTTDSVSSFDNDLCRGPNKLCGCLTVLVTKAFDIPLKVDKAASFVKVSFDKQEFYTSVVTDYPGLDALNPCYDASFMIPLTSDIVNSASNVDGVIELNLLNNIDTMLGTTTITLADLSKVPGMSMQERRKIGRGGASVEFRVTMYGIDTSNMSAPLTTFEAEGADAANLFPTPVKQITVLPNVNRSAPFSSPRAGDMGKVRITAVRGRGFKVQKKTFKKDDIPDVYIRMNFGQNKQKWRTSTIKDSVEPVWDESTTFALNDQDERLTIDVYDEDKGMGDSDDCEFTTPAKQTSHVDGYKFLHTIFCDTFSYYSMIVLTLPLLFLFSSDLGSAQISVSELLIAAKETELPLAITKFGKPKETGAFVTVDCDIIGVELDSSFGATSVESLGMSSSGSVGSVESGQGSLVFGSKDFR